MKKHITLIIATLLLSTTLASCIFNADTEVNTEPVEQAQVEKEEITPVMYTNKEFNLNLLKAIYSNSSTNVFYSEYSINSALSMVLLGADGKSKQEMLDTLGYSGVDDCTIGNKFEASIAKYNNMQDCDVNVANSIWIDNSLDINKDYSEKIELTFDAEARDIDLQDSDTVGVMNSWINDKTNGMIANMIQKPFSAMDKLVLINAIYFKGGWTEPFDENSNRDMTFEGRDSSTDDIAMMTKREGINGYISDDYRAISLPYGDNKEMSMVMVLPDGDISEFINELDDAKYDDLFEGFQHKSSGYIVIPKFEIEERVQMNSILQSLGIQEAYVTQTDFNNIGEGLSIGEVIHQAKVIVDEQGTEAAAATMVSMMLTSALDTSEPFEFIANRPFIFFIVDNEDNSPLFTGVINNMG